MRRVEEKGITFDDVLLVPKYSEIESRLSDKIDLTTNLTTNIELSKPVVSSPMTSVTNSEFADDMYEHGAAGIVHRFQSQEEQICNNSLSPCAVGLKDYDRLDFLYKRDLRCFLIDVANGYTKMVGDDIKYYKDKYGGIEIIAGNIVTSEAARYLIECGADALRVGIGGSSVCSTRIVTGCGVPNLTAIKWVREGINYFNGKKAVYLIADGGIRGSGDAIKCFAFGADVVMLGRLLAGFSSAGRIIKQNNQVMKVYEGMASRKFQESFYGNLKKGTTPEGVEYYVHMRYDMALEEYLDEFCGGIRSGMSYLNCHNIRELRDCSYMEISQASKIESYPRIEGEKI